MYGKQHGKYSIREFYFPISRENKGTLKEAPSLGLGIVHSTKVILGLPETAGVHLPPYDTIL